MAHLVTNRCVPKTFCCSLQVKKYESQRVANKSTYWVIFELIWCVWWQTHVVITTSTMLHACAAPWCSYAFGTVHVLYAGVLPPHPRIRHLVPCSTRRDHCIALSSHDCVRHVDSVYDSVCDRRDYFKFF